LTCDKQKRSTKQKRVIYEILANTDSHPTADWIYEQARQQIPTISLGTIYRNLQLMADENKILELNYGKGQSRFDGNPQPHYHFVCEKCGRVWDFSPAVTGLTKMIIDAAPGKITSHRLECYGVCLDCLDT